MDSPRLLSLPTELLHHLCLFLPEEDLLSLFQTCLQVHKALNTNLVWKRFVTEEVRRLRTREQLLHPPLLLDPNYCKDLQHVLRKNRLLSNWRNGIFSQHSSPHGVNPEDLDFTLHHFSRTNTNGENYLITYRSENASEKSEIWEIRTDPKILQTRIGRFRGENVVGDFLVRIRGKTIEVYDIKIIIEGKQSAPLYSFPAEGEKVSNEVIVHPERPCCQLGECIKTENIQVFVSRKSTRPVLHIWDIVNAKKVGAFVTPEWCKYVESSWLTRTNNCIYIMAMNHQNEFIYLKIELRPKLLLKGSFKLEIDQRHALFHEDHCIFMNIEDGNTIKIEVFEFDTSKKIAEGRFESQHSSMVEGKLVILTSECFHIVDALSLETVTIVPHGNVLCIMHQTSVFGSIFLVTVDVTGSVKIWDIEKKSSTLIPQVQFSDLMISHVIRDFQNHGLVYGNEPTTKFVICEEEKMFVINFW